MLALGRFLHRIDRNRRGRLYGSLGRQSRFDLHDKPHHVHRFQRRFHCSHMLCLHVQQKRLEPRQNSRMSVRTRSSDFPRCDQYHLGRNRPNLSPKLYFHGVLQDDIFGYTFRRSTRYVLIARTVKPFRTRRL